MDKLKVNIEEKGPGYASAIAKGGKKIFIRNGDLKKENSYQVYVLSEDENFIIAEIPETYENQLAIHELKDKEGLISCAMIDAYVTDSVFQLNKKWVFPEKTIEGIVDYLLEFPTLLDYSKLALTGTRLVKHRAVHFGLTFSQALQKLESRGIQKARLYCEDIKSFSKQGVVAEMLVNLSKDQNGLITIECWQGVEGENYVFYIHGIIDEAGGFQHFDGAIIGFDLQDIELLFSENRKLKGGTYKKLFRLDGNIKKEDVFEIANRFFPLDKLIDEYFEIRRIE